MKRISTPRTLAYAGFVLFLFLTALLATPLVTTAQAHPSTFLDVAENNPAHEAIEYLAAQEVVDGYPGGDFHPANPITRAQAMKMLVSWRDLSRVESGSSFSDVSSLYSAYVETAVEQGWVTGYADGTFRPQTPLTRQQTAIVIVRTLGLETAAMGLTAEEVRAILDGFADGAAVASVARPYVALAVDRGLFAGDGDRLEPAVPITRGQLCLVIYRAAVSAVSEDDSAQPGAGTVDGVAEPPAQGKVDGVAFTPEELALAAFMDDHLFRPHNSPVTGAMVLQNAHWYGIPALPQLVIMAAETSLGDPRLGGAVARSNNFGCLSYHGSDTPWGELSDGSIHVAGRDWYSFPSPAEGMAAFGRYLKSAMEGRYVPLLSAEHPLWEEFAAAYYGRGVSGFGNYVNRLQTFEARFREMVAEQGLTF